MSGGNDRILLKVREAVLCDAMTFDPKQNTPLIGDEFFWYRYLELKLLFIQISYTTQGEISGML